MVKYNTYLVGSINSVPSLLTQDEIKNCEKLLESINRRLK